MLLVEELISHVELEIQVLQSSLDIQNDFWIRAMDKRERGEISEEDYLKLESKFGQVVGNRVSEIEIKEELLLFLRMAQEKATEQFD